ncbi:alpha/beta fold hydrolase [Cryptosporangium aurantiacum]|uniref:Pimeloyl-ACP methyl ester carboxylesterase n=1 Tax=Cryptosporangium aurantiacum TaxID=134849 RepID=A0A1M7N3K1_9ACTN|nr:alpha/beta hydrolase [Cryptosporangium aurantiacum]SHM98097.1 Pimeloyl-ACP methyl ester carboxylesterase [Cryptosporangium aurantiacum]
MSTATMTTVRSADGTPIDVQSTGCGPGLVVVPGNNRRTHHYDALARELAQEFTVHVVDRRGHGRSGPQGPHYSIEAEAADVFAVLRETGSNLLFGHSHGGLVALHLALWRPVDALVVYEPVVSIGGSFDASWLPEFRRQLATGRHAAAMATFLKGTRMVPLGDAPMFVYRGLAYLLLHGADAAETRAMMSATPAEVAEIARLDSDGRRYAGIRSPTLLLGGGRTADYLTTALRRLHELMPDAECRIRPELDHNAPDLNGAATVAAEIMSFVARRAAHQSV